MFPSDTVLLRKVSGLSLHVTPTLHQQVKTDTEINVTFAANPRLSQIISSYNISRS